MSIQLVVFQQVLRARSMAGASAAARLLGPAGDLANSVLPAEKPIRLVGVTVSNFEDVASEAGEGALPLLA